MPHLGQSGYRPLPRCHGIPGTSASRRKAVGNLTEHRTGRCRELTHSGPPAEAAKNLKSGTTAPGWFSVQLKQWIGRETVRPGEIFFGVDIKERIDSAYLPLNYGYAVRGSERVDLADTVI